MLILIMSLLSGPVAHAKIHVHCRVVHHGHVHVDDQGRVAVDGPFRTQTSYSTDADGNTIVTVNF